MTQGDMKFYADLVEYFGDTNRLIATGNVLLIEPDHQIAADRADFNAEDAAGHLLQRARIRHAGHAGERSTVRQARIDPDVQFYGETLEKASDDTYVITNGGFTSCVQANPRWEMTSGSLKLRVDHYALLRNMLLKVKGVPALYLPVMYYPLSKDNRSTGFLMPSYGSSTLQGPDDQQRLFLGDQPQPGRDVPARLVLEDRPSDRRRVSVRLARRIGQLPIGLPQRAADRRSSDTDGEEVEQAGRRSFRMYGNLSQSARRLVVRAGARRLLLRPHGRSALQHGHRARVAAHAEATADRSAARPRGCASPAPTIATSTSPRTDLVACAATRRASTSRGPIGCSGGCRSTRRSTRSTCASSQQQFNKRPTMRRRTTASIASTSCRPCGFRSTSSRSSRSTRPRSSATRSGPTA